MLTVEGIRKTMTLDQLLLVLILVGIMILFVWGRWRYDLVALMGLLACVIVGVVPSPEAFQGFAHPATITVAAVFIISKALTNAGVTDSLTRLLYPMAPYPVLYVLAFLLTGAFMSAFMNNVGALAILMPVAIQSSISANRSPGMILMPLSFGTMLGGMTTLIGTPSNIIIATFREKELKEPFGMFDFTAVGSIVAFTGILFISLVGWRFISKKKREAKPSQDLLDIEAYVTEAQVTEKSKTEALTLGDLEEAADEFDVVLAGFIRAGKLSTRLPLEELLRKNDILILEGEPADFNKFIAKYKLKLIGASGAIKNVLSSRNAGMAEAIVSPGSPLEGRQVSSVPFQRRYGISLMGISRQGKSFRGRLKQVKFKVGDILLFYGNYERIPDMFSALKCLPLLARSIPLQKTFYPWFSLVVFAGAIALSAMKICPIQITLALAALLLVISGILPLRDLYESIDWPVIVLLGAMIPVGYALESTQTAKALVTILLGPSTEASPVFVLTLVMLITMCFSDILNNAATTLVMAPIALNLAKTMGVNSDPFLMAVAVGASCAFLTPIGHQNNALIMGPGGYGFNDYWRMGLPLEILIVVTGIPMILYVWPF